MYHQNLSNVPDIFKVFGVLLSNTYKSEFSRGTLGISPQFLASLPFNKVQKQAWRRFHDLELEFWPKACNMVKSISLPPI